MTGPNRGIGTSLTFIQSFLPESTFTVDFRKYVVTPQDPTVTETDKKTHGVVKDSLDALNTYLAYVLVAAYHSLPTKATVLRFLGYNPKAAYHTPFADVSTMLALLDWNAAIFPFMVLKKAYAYYTHLNPSDTNLLAKYNETGINTAHIFAKELEFNDADVPAEIQVDDLLALYDEINFLDVAAPNYKDPLLLEETSTLETTEVPIRYTPKALRGGVLQFIKNVETKAPFLGTAQENNKEELEKLYKRVVACVRLTLHLLVEEKKKFLENNGTDYTQYTEEQKKEYGNILATRVQVAIDFGMAGHACGSRYTATSEEIYTNLQGPSLDGTLKDNFGEILARFRKGVAQQATYGEGVHFFNRYLVELGELLGIPGSKGITEELLSSLPYPKEYYIERFFRSYTVEDIIKAIQDFVIITGKEKEQVALSAKFCNNLRDWVQEQLDTGTNKKWLPEVYDRQQKILSKYERLVTEITDEIIEIIYDDDDDKEARIQETLALSSESIRPILFKGTEEIALRTKQEERHKRQASLLTNLFGMFNLLQVEWSEERKAVERAKLDEANRTAELQFDQVKVQNRTTAREVIKNYLHTEIVEKLSQEGTKRERFVKYEEYVTETVEEVKNIVNAADVDVSRQIDAFKQLQVFVTSLQAACPQATSIDEGAVAYWTPIFQGTPASEKDPQQTIASLLHFIHYKRATEPLTGSDWKVFLNEARALLSDTAITRPSFSEIHRLVDFCQEQTQNEKFQALITPLFDGTTLKDDQIREVFVRSQKINRICRLVNLSSFTINKILAGADLEGPVRDAIDQERRTAFLHELNLNALQEKGIPPNLLEWILVDHGILHPQNHLVHAAPAKQDPVVLTPAEIDFQEIILKKFGDLEFSESSYDPTTTEDLITQARYATMRGSLVHYAKGVLSKSKHNLFEETADRFISARIHNLQMNKNMNREPFPILDKKKYIIDYIFNYTFTHFPDIVIAEAEKATGSQEEFYPNSFAKRVCWEYIPRAIVKLTPLFKIAVTLGLMYAFATTTTKAEKIASTFTATKLMPFVTENAPSALLTTCRKVIDAIPAIFTNPSFTPITYITFYKNNPEAPKNIIPLIYDVTRAVVTEGSKPFKITEILSNTIMRITASINIRNFAVVPDNINYYQGVPNEYIARLDAPRWERVWRQEQAARTQLESNTGAPTSETPLSPPTIPTRLFQAIKQIPSLLMKTAKAALPVLKLLSAECWSLQMLQWRFFASIPRKVDAQADAISYYFQQCINDAKKKRIEVCRNKAYAMWCKVTDPASTIKEVISERLQGVR